VHVSSALLLLCGGFLLAVLWFDLMFDVQVLRHRRAALVPEPVLASIAGYYRRVTTAARPMGHAVGAVMAVLLIAILYQLHFGTGPRRVGQASLVLAGVPIVLASLRVVPSAVRLGARTGTPAEQSALARAICRDHLLCFAGIAAFLALRLWAAAS
jgi:hypothetical protein